MGRLDFKRLAAVVVWGLVALGAAWAVVRLLGLERGFPLVALISYTPYVALAALLALIAAAILRLWAAVCVAALIVGALAVLVVPRAFSDGDSPDPSRPPLVVLATNLKLGNGDPSAVVELARDHDVDVISIQELTPRAITGLHEAGIEQLFPKHLLLPAPASGGSGLYARYPLRPFGGSEPASAFFMARATIEVPGTGEVELMSVHPQPPTGGPEVDAWQSELRGLPRATPGAGLRVLAGDFNATLDHDELRDLLASGYTDAADAAGAGLTPTWPAGRLFPPPVTIDHVLADERIEIGGVSIHEIPGSDHRAVLAELYLPAEAEFAD